MTQTCTQCGFQGEFINPELVILNKKVEEEGGKEKVELEAKQGKPSAQALLGAILSQSEDSIGETLRAMFPRDIKIIKLCPKCGEQAV